MRETLENLSCGSCGGRAMEPVKHQLSLQVLRGENILLTKEVSKLFCKIHLDQGESHISNKINF